MATEIGLTPILVGIAGGSGSGENDLNNSDLRASWEPVRPCNELRWVLQGTLAICPLKPVRQRILTTQMRLDIEALTRDLHQLKAGNSIEVPIYDFTTHTRAPIARLVHPTLIVLIEGILLFAIEAVRSLLALRVFVDAPADIRFIRRMARDIEERGRTVDSVIQQYLSTTRLMHDAFVEPSKAFADMVVSGEEKIEGLTARLLERIQALTSC